MDSSSPLATEMTNHKPGSIRLKTGFPLPGVLELFYARFTTEIKLIPLEPLLLVKHSLGVLSSP